MPNLVAVALIHGYASVVANNNTLRTTDVEQHNAQQAS